MTPAFEKAVEKLFDLEGFDEYTDDPKDYGRETKWGISKRWHPDVDVKNLTKGGAKEIYFREYWKPLRLDHIHDDRIAFEIFEQAVNFSPADAAKHAQRALRLLGVPVELDGRVGSQTIGALNGYKHKEALLKTLNGVQFMEYVKEVEGDPAQKYHFRGWLRRLSFCILLVFALAGCGSIPKEFFTKDKDVSIAGLYAVHPTYGLTGLGYLSYESKQADPDRVAKLEKEIEKLKEALLALIYKFYKEQEDSSGSGNEPRKESQAF